MTTQENNRKKNMYFNTIKINAVPKLLFRVNVKSFLNNIQLCSEIIILLLIMLLTLETHIFDRKNYVSYDRVWLFFCKQNYGRI